MKQALIYTVGVVFSLSALLMPLSASALGLSFGGRIIGPVPIPCLSILGPALWFTDTPAGGDDVPLHIYVTGTSVGVPPAHIGQEILGLEDTLLGCCLPPTYPSSPLTCSFAIYTVPAPFQGLRVQLDGVSV